MSIFDGKRLDDDTFKLDIERMRRGWYTDKYFSNITTMLTSLAAQDYRFHPKTGTTDLAAPGISALISTEGVPSGDLEVEMQWFTRRDGPTVVVGIDKALAMLKHCSGYWEGDHFIETADRLQVWALKDGALIHGSGNPLLVEPVLRVRGRYRDFAILETPTLGILTRSSRVATNVYEALIAARGKPLLFFPARFDLHEVQAADGYAYRLAVQRFNQDYSSTLGPFISTDAQGDWWGGSGGGTVAHAAIACFLGDTAEAMLAFARILPPSISRIALVDFNNDCITDSLVVCKAMFDSYRELISQGNETEAERFKLYGVRLDTSGSLRDRGIPPLGDPKLDLGVTPRLVFAVRQALDNAWKSWDLPLPWQNRAQSFCQDVKIVVSGGFNPEKIGRFEKLEVPVDIYAVGSALFDNHGNSVTDFTADVVRVNINGEWRDLAKVGRKAIDNPAFERVW